MTNQNSQNLAADIVAENNPDTTVTVSATEEIEFAESEQVTENAKELTFDEKVERVTKLIRQNPNYRMVFYRILKRCQGEAQPLDELEQFVDAQPGYARLKQPPFFPVHWLEQAWALEETYLDAQGKLYYASDVAGLDEDEFDDLVVQYAYLTTDVGEFALYEANPARKLAELYDKEPDRAGLYTEILKFATSKRSFADINRLIREKGESYGVTLGKQGVMPNVLVDRLAEADGVVFDEGWQITEEGRGFLESPGEEGK